MSVLSQSARRQFGVAGLSLALLGSFVGTASAQVTQVQGTSSEAGAAINGNSSGAVIELDLGDQNYENLRQSPGLGGTTLPSGTGSFTGLGVGADGQIVCLTPDGPVLTSWSISGSVPVPTYTEGGNLGASFLGIGVQGGRSVSTSEVNPETVTTLGTILEEARTDSALSQSVCMALTMYSIGQPVLGEAILTAATNSILATAGIQEAVLASLDQPGGYQIAQLGRHIVSELQRVRAANPQMEGSPEMDGLIADLNLVNQVMIDLGKGDLSPEVAQVTIDEVYTRRATEGTIQRHLVGML